MKQKLDWQDLKLFLAVAQSGGLAGASRETGVSVATLGRRVAALENSLNVRLVERGSHGYALTVQGEDLLQYAADMNEIAGAIENWTELNPVKRRVRISAGEWTMRLLIDHAASFWNSRSDWRPEFLADRQKRDIARRQVDIGIRNVPPDQPWLAGQKVGYVEFAVYQSAKLESDNNLGWIGMAEDDVHSGTGRWIAANHQDDVEITVNKLPLALSLVRQGLGKTLLPMFVGDAYSDLFRVSEPVAKLKTERWLITHHEDRNEPAIRQALNALSKVLRKNPVLRGNAESYSQIIP